MEIEQYGKGGGTHVVAELEQWCLATVKQARNLEWLAKNAPDEATRQASWARAVMAADKARRLARFVEKGQRRCRMVVDAAGHGQRKAD